MLTGFPSGVSGKELTCQCRRHRRQGFDFWVGKIPLEEKMATHSSLLAWKIPWMEEPGELQFMGSQRAQHKLATKQQYQTLLHQRRQSDICSLGFQTKHRHFFSLFLSSQVLNFDLRFLSTTFSHTIKPHTYIPPSLHFFSKAKG